MPVLIGLLGQALVQAVAKPWPWLTLLGFFAISKFDFGIFAEEIRVTVWGLWPFVVLVVLLWFGLLFFGHTWNFRAEKEAVKLGRREERFVHRVVVLLTTAVVMGIGVVVVKESREIQKLVEPSTARDLLLLFAPLAGLAMTGYSLVSKTFSSGALLGEFFAILGSYSLFMAVALPSFIKT